MLGAKSSQINQEARLGSLAFTAVVPDQYKDYTQKQAEEYAAYLKNQ